MLLYLVRHADAEDHEDDAKRPLSKKGRNDIERIACHLEQLGITVDRIIHSPLLRARQTADILSKSLAVKKTLEEASGLLPGDHPAIWAKKLKKEDGSVMLVGHQPHMGGLASILIGLDGEQDAVTFKKAAVACFEGAGNSWSLQWLITPKIIGKRSPRS